MRKGDIVVCTNDIFFKERDLVNPYPITKGKQYEVIGNSNAYGQKTIFICDDLGDISGYGVNRFKFLSDIREDKLKELGI